MISRMRKNARWTPELIRALRMAQCQTQEEFAAELDCSLGTVRSWEQGQGSPPRSMEKMLDILKAKLSPGIELKPAPKKFGRPPKCTEPATQSA
jgi:DNA-binding transcriptional regulator YiaG